MPYTILVIEPDRAIMQAITGGSSSRYNWYQDMRPQTFELIPGGEFEIEADGLGMRLEPGKCYNVTGSWLNYTKRLPAPDLVLGITSAQLVTI